MNKIKSKQNKTKTQTYKTQKTNKKQQQQQQQQQQQHNNIIYICREDGGGEKEKRKCIYKCLLHLFSSIQSWIWHYVLRW